LLPKLKKPSVRRLRSRRSGFKKEGDQPFSEKGHSKNSNKRREDSEKRNCSSQPLGSGRTLGLSEHVRRQAPICWIAERRRTQWGERRFQRNWDREKKGWNAILRRVSRRVEAPPRRRGLSGGLNRERARKKKSSGGGKKEWMFLSRPKGGLPGEERKPSSLLCCPREHIRKSQPGREGTRIYIGGYLGQKGPTYARERGLSKKSASFQTYR